MAARVDALAAGLAALDRSLGEAFTRINTLAQHVRRLEEDRPAADSCDMRAPLPELSAEEADDYDPSPECNCETCPRGGPYTCIRHD